MQSWVGEFLLLFLAALILIVCRAKGLRSLVSLGVSIFVLIKIIVPLILRGYDPLFVILVAAIPVFLLVIYLTEGFTIISHITSVAVFGNFLFTSVLATLIIHAGHLTGLASEEDAFVGGYCTHGIDLPHLLTAGIMLGTLGVLIEMIVTQVTTVSEAMQTNKELTSKQIFSQAYAIGVAHLGSLINTLFLMYAGVSFSLLIILIGRDSSIVDLLNSELVVTEVIRTIVGTIGVIIAMPTSTALTVWWFFRAKSKQNQII